MRLLLFLLFLVPQTCFLQVVSTLPSSQTILDADTFWGVDKYNSIYYSKDSALHKKAADKSYRFSDVQLGKMSGVDFINPLRISLFYERFQTVVILDNTLNEITRINFNTLANYRNISHAHTASDRRLWIFNVDAQQLELFDYRSNRVEASSPPLSKTATFMASDFNSCWLYARGNLNTYNNYGSLITSMELKKVSQIQAVDDNVLYEQEGKLRYGTDEIGGGIIFDLVEKQTKQWYWASGILYIYNGKILTSYPLKLTKN